MKSIIELAREAGLVLSCDMQDGYIRDGRYDKQLERFATLIRNATLDEAAGVIEAIADEYGDEEVSATWIAAAIRQLKTGEQT